MISPSRARWFAGRTLVVACASGSLAPIVPGCGVGQRHEGAMGGVAGDTGVGGTTATTTPAGGEAANTAVGGTGGSAGGATPALAGAGGDGSAAAGEGGGVGDGAAGAGGGDVGGAAGAGGSVSVDCSTDGDGKTTLVFVNGCSDTLTFRGSDIDDGTLAPGASRCVDIGSDVEELPAKRYWGFRGEDPGAEHHTLAEFTFNTDFNDFDWYNISHVDAFNLPMQIVPLERDCQTLTCAEDLVPDCPEVGKLANVDGDVVACVSPDRDDGNSEVALYFEQCEDAYAWSGDDQNGEDSSPVRACAGEDWNIVFCPEGGM